VAPQNPELVREDTLRRAEEHLSHAVDVAKAGGVTLAELTETLNLLYGDETL
jgi:GntR family transcriptional regulator